MKFQKGQIKPVNSGRKKGIPNAKKIIKASEILAMKDKNPTEEILKIIPELEPRDQVRAWLELLSYTEAKPKEPESDDSGSSQESDGELTVDDILELVDVTPKEEK